MMLFSVAGPICRASIIRGMYEVREGLYVMGIVVSDSVGGWGWIGFVTFCARIASGDVSVLVVFDIWASRAVRTFGALSAGALRLVVSLI